MSPSENTLAGKIAFVFLCLFALGLAFSISIAQTGLGLAFLVFLATLVTRRGRATLSLAAAPRLRILYVSFLLWTFWRIYHVVVSPTPVAELIEAREVWLMLIPLFIYFYASGRKRLWILAACFVIGVAVSSAYGAWQMRADFLNMVRGKGMSTMHHLNYAGMAALATLLGIGLTWASYYAGKKGKAVGFLILTLICATGLWLTKSRGVIAAVGVLLPLVFFLQVRGKAQRTVFVIVVVGLAALFISRLPDSVANEFKFPPPESHGGSQAERRDLWLIGYTMIKDKPVTGWGERGYNLAYPRYQIPGAQGVVVYDAKEQSASHMHNDFINTWVLYGLVGLLIQLFYYFFGYFIYLRERFKIRLESDRPLAAAAASCLPLMAFMGVTQCHFTSEIVQMSFWLVLGVLFALLESDRAGTKTGT